MIAKCFLQFSLGAKRLQFVKEFKYFGHYNTTTSSSDAEVPVLSHPTSDLRLYLARTCVCLIIIITNNMVLVVFRVCTFYIHTAATVVWDRSCVTEMAPGQNVSSSRARL